MNQEKKSLGGAIAFIVAFLALYFIIDWLFYLHLISINESKPIYAINGILDKLGNKLVFLRILFIVLLACASYLSPSFKAGKNMSKKNKNIYFIYAFATASIFLVGYLRFYIYDLIIYPVAFIFMSYFISKAVAVLRKPIQQEDFFKGVTSKKSDFCFEFPTNQGVLRVHSPQQHIWVDGGPGSGKSATIAKPIIFQCAEKQYPGVIYDFKGDPREPGLPDLCNTAYASVILARQKAIQKGEDYNLKFAFINFVDPTRSARVNILSNKYISGFLDIKDLSVNLFKNLSKTAKDKQDFWSEYGTSYIYGVMYRLWKGYQKEGYATLPHVITTCLSDISDVFRWLIEDPEIDMIMQPLVSAFKQQALTQVSGGTSTGQLPFASLLEPNIFWVLSSDDLNLDITNPKSPTLLGIANSNKVSEAVAPVISCLLSVIMKQMNSTGKQPSIFLVDEFPTVYINGVDQFMATCRSNNVSVILTVQDFQQAERDYGKQSSHILRSTCGTVFQGMTSSFETAKAFSDWVGDTDKISVSYTENPDSTSQSESLKKEKIIQPRDVAGQHPGHFMGKVAGGDPPFYSAQFEYREYEKKDLPLFSNDIKTGNEVTDTNITKALVKQNFDKILTDVKTMLKQFSVSDD